jgi:hypothetical protein
MAGYRLIRRFKRRIPKFRVVGTEYRLIIEPFPDGLSYIEITDRLYDLLDSLLHELMYDEETGAIRWPDHHRVRISLQSANLHHDIYVPFIPPSEMTADRIMLSVERVLQLNDSWLAHIWTTKPTFPHN